LSKRLKDEGRMRPENANRKRKKKKRPRKRREKKNVKKDEAGYGNVCFSDK